MLADRVPDGEAFASPWVSGSEARIAADLSGLRVSSKSAYAAQMRTLCGRPSVRQDCWPTPGSADVMSNVNRPSASLARHSGMLHHEQIAGALAARPRRRAGHGDETLGLVQRPGPPVPGLDVQPDPLRTVVVVCAGERGLQQSPSLTATAERRCHDHPGQLDDAITALQPCQHHKSGHRTGLTSGKVRQVRICQCPLMPSRPSLTQPLASVSGLLYGTHLGKVIRRGQAQRYHEGRLTSQPA
jgi:hypothetical protein